MTSSDSSVTRCETCELPMQYDDGHHPPPGSAYEPPCVNCADHPFVPAPAPSTDLASEVSVAHDIGFLDGALQMIERMPRTFNVDALPDMRAALARIQAAFKESGRV